MYNALTQDKPNGEQILNEIYEYLVGEDVKHLPKEQIITQLENITDGMEVSIDNLIMARNKYQSYSSVLGSELVPLAASLVIGLGVGVLTYFTGGDSNHMSLYSLISWTLSIAVFAGVKNYYERGFVNALEQAISN